MSAPRTFTPPCLSPRACGARNLASAKLTLALFATVDIYLGPTAPKGFEQNWIPTVPGRASFAGFRFYGPLEPYFDKSWPLPDIETVK